MPPGASPGDTRALHAYVAVAAAEPERPGIGIVFVNAGGRVLRRVRQALPAGTPRELAAFRGILYALWTSRRLGSRRVVVHSDTPAAVACINGRRDVEPSLVGPYLEVRALLHAYRSARVETDQMGWARDALAIAETAREQDPYDVEDLPLWVRATAVRAEA